MSAKGLQTLIASTICDGAHKAALLSSKASAYEGFDLSAEEVTMLLSIEANSLEEFAAQAHKMFYAEDLIVDVKQRRFPSERRVSA